MSRPSMYCVRGGGGGGKKFVGDGQRSKRDGGRCLWWIRSERSRWKVTDFFSGTVAGAFSGSASDQADGSGGGSVACCR